MPQFDLENASVSSSFVSRLTVNEAIVPFVYWDLRNAGQSILKTGATADPAISNFQQSNTGMANVGYYSKCPVDPDRHLADLLKNSTPTFGIGQTIDAFVKPGTTSIWPKNDSALRYTNDNHRLNLYDILHDEDKGIRVQKNGTWYNVYFPIEHDLSYTTNSTGGGWIDTTQSGTDDDGIGNTGVVQNNEPIPIRYIGDGTSVTRSDGVTIIKARPSQDMLNQLVSTAVTVQWLPGVIDAFYRYDKTGTSWVKETDSNGDYILESNCFPYDTTIAQEHFDMMVDIAWHKGVGGFKHSWFLQVYKYDDTEDTLRDGSTITTSSDLDAYKDAAYAMGFFGVVYDKATKKYFFKQWAVDRYRKHVQTLLNGSYFSGSLSSMTPAFGVDPNPIADSANWYQGHDINKNWFFAPDAWYGGYFTAPGGVNGWSVRKGQSAQGGVANPSIITDSSIDPNTLTESEDNVQISIDQLIDNVESLPLPSTDFWQGKNSTGANVDYADYYSGARSIFDSDAGTVDYWSTDPNFQAYYSKYWQDGSSWFHGTTAYSKPRAKTKHGAVIASTQHSSLPSFMIGLNENGAGTSKVYMRSVTSTSTVLSGVATDDCFDIANGKSLGLIDYNQWNHFAITREGNNFYTFKNGTMVDSWRSEKAIKIPQPDVKLWLSTGLNLSIGLSQGADHFYGYLDGLRITKGTAKHTIDANTGVATYSVPTAAPTVETTQSDYSGTHYLETVLTALNRIATQLDIEWKVRIGTTADDTNRPIPSGTNVGKVLLDMGPRTSLFVGHGLNDNAETIVVRGTSGEDPSITGIDPSSIKSSFDAREYVSTVEYLETIGGQNFDTLDVTDDAIPYRDINGGLLERVVYASEPQHPHISKEERARAFLKELKRVKRAIDLDLDYYDIQGDFEVGDNIFIYDPELGFEDNEAKRIEEGRTSLFEVAYQGEYINPEKIRVTSITHPIKSGMGIYLRRLRSSNSTEVEYIDLTPYVQFESGGARLEVGDLPLKLGDDLRFSPTVTGITAGSKVTFPGKVRDPDNTLTNGINLTSGFIQDALGAQQAIIKIEWIVPLNDDGSIIQNGSHYNIRYRKSGTTDPYSESSVTWGAETFTIEGLALATQYEVGVQPINNNGATGDYVTDFITTSVDTVKPLKPDQAVTISAGAMRTQIIHNLGAAEDTNRNPVSNVVDFTLQNDIDHLNVYYSQSSGFSITGTTPKAQIPVTASHIRNEIPAIGEVQVANGETYYFRFTVVDKAGNESDPSTEQSATGNLIQTQNISNAAITEAQIANLAVTTAKIVDGNITNAKIGDTIQSDNYVAGTSGWIIEKQNANYPNGYVEFSDGVFRGSLTAETGTIGGWDIAADTLKADYTTGGTTYYLTLDATAGTIEGNYTAGSSGFQIGADGSVEFNDGTFRGDLTGATGTFSGGINIGNGTFVVNSQGGVTLSSITGFHITP